MRPFPRSRPLFDEGQRFLQPFSAVILQKDQPAGQGGAHAAVDGGPGHVIHVDVHVGIGGGPRADHLRHRQHRTPVNVFFVHPRFHRQHLFLQPFHQAKVVAEGAHQGHRRVVVGVDQTGHRHHARGVDHLIRPPFPAGDDGGDPVPFDQNVPGKGFVVFLHRQNERSADQQTHPASPPRFWSGGAYRLTQRKSQGFYPGCTAWTRWRISLICRASVRYPRASNQASRRERSA